MKRTSEITLKQPIIYNETLDDTDWHKVNFSENIRAIAIQCRSRENILINYEGTNPDNYWTIKKGSTKSIDTSLSNQDDSNKNKSFWIKTENPTVTVEIEVGE